MNELRVIKYLFQIITTRYDIRSMKLISEFNEIYSQRELYVDLEQIPMLSFSLEY